MIQNFDAKKQYESMRDEIDEAVLRVLGSGWYLLGKELEEFEAEFATWVGSENAVGVHSGTDALALSLRSLSIGKGDEVITTPLTAVFTAYAISSVGAVPVLVDINQNDYNISPVEIEKNITRKTKAIIPVHLHGYPCDMESIMKIARDHDLKVIEDCAQAHGAKYDGKKVGTFGNAGCFSFYPTKNLGAFGDGGIVVTNDENIAEQIRLLRNGSLSDRANYIHDEVSIHSRLDEIQSAILRVKLKHLDDWTEDRRAVARIYDECLSDLPVSLPPVAGSRDHVYHLYVIGTNKRDELRKYLKANGIGTQVHYPTPLHLQPAYAYLELGNGSFPNAEKAAGEILSLPMYPELREKEVEEVCEVLRMFLSK